MNECWKKSEVAPNQESGFLSELAKCAFAAALLHLWEPRNQDQTGHREPRYFQEPRNREDPGVWEPNEPKEWEPRKLISKGT